MPSFPLARSLDLMALQDVVKRQNTDGLAWNQSKLWFVVSHHKYIKSILQCVQLKIGPHFIMSNLFTKIYNMLYYTTKLYLQ